MKTYKATEGARISDAEAELYGTRLSELEETHGAITPLIIVEDAKDKASPLHAYFEWNNRKAAEAYRIEQAKLLIRSIATIIVETTNRGMEEKKIRIWHSVRNASGENVYVDLENARENDDYMRQIIAYAWQQLEGWRERYGMYAEFKQIAAAIEETKKKRKMMIGIPINL